MKVGHLPCCAFLVTVGQSLSPSRSQHKRAKLPLRLLSPADTVCITGVKLMLGSSFRTRDRATVQPGCI